MTTQHTPGPWRTVRFGSKFDARNHSFGVAYGRSGSRLAIVDGEGSSGAANAANARLIAAAPDLLAALKDLLDMVGPLDDIPMIRRKQVAQKAIAKAEGAGFTVLQAV
jgi:hypothetical protein